MSMHPTPSPVRFRHGGLWSAAAGQDAAAHRYAQWKVTYYRTGRIDSIVDGVRHEVGPGDVLVLPPGASHEEIAHTAYSDYYLILDAPADSPWPASCRGDAAHDIGWLLPRILREAATGERELLPALLELLDLTLRRARPAERLTPAQSAVRAAEEIFEDRYPGRLTIAEVARSLGVAPSTLRHYFATERRASPLETLQAVRLRHALTLLRSSDLTLAAIAERCGFDSASHLSRRVKAATGSSPGRLR